MIKASAWTCSRCLKLGRKGKSCKNCGGSIHNPRLLSMPHIQKIIDRTWFPGVGPKTPKEKTLLRVRARRVKRQVNESKNGRNLRGMS